MSITQLSERTEVQADVIALLSKALADTMVETTKSQTYHWNVTGMSFVPLHNLFQEIYEDHFIAQDKIAERIKALGAYADGRLSDIVNKSTIKETHNLTSAKEMVRDLAEDQKILSKAFLHLANIADENGDLVTNDLAVDRAEKHDKFAWMLNAHLSE